MIVSEMKSYRLGSARMARFRDQSLADRSDRKYAIEFIVATVALERVVKIHRDQRPQPEDVSTSSQDRR
jgi:hypothetical protein